MKKIFSCIAIAASALLVITACNKVGELPYYGNGNAVALTASKTTVTSTPAQADSTVISFSWTNPKYATDSSTYKYVLEIDSTGRNFSRATPKTVSGVSGTTLSGRELNAAMLNYGFTIGTAYTLDVRVVSSYANNNERYVSNTVKITATPYADAPTFSSTSTVVTASLNNASVRALTFSWTRPFSGYTGNITYSVQYDSTGKNFASPHEVALGSNLLTRDMTQGEINQTALDEAVPGGTPGRIEYRIKAVTANGATVFSNVIAVTVNTYVPLLRFYMPGSYQTATGNGSDWTPNDAPEFVRDLRTSGQLNRLYYMYIYLPAGTEFKITPARNWNVSYGPGANGSLSASASGNISVPAAGNYRVSIDVVNMKYDIREGRMGAVGEATNNGWNPPGVFPTYALGLGGTNLFTGLVNFEKTGGWKLIDNNAWNGGTNTLDETRSYGSNGASGSSLIINGSENMPNIAAAGRYRIIWDGRDVNNIKYQQSDGSMMKIIGDGINQTGVNDWDPPTALQMTYAGNGVWTIRVGLRAGKEFKFLAGVTWSAFDYEDASKGSTATGVARKIDFDQPDPSIRNFKTPATAGTYTITLNENTQTVTVTP